MNMIQYTVVVDTGYCLLDRANEMSNKLLYSTSANFQHQIHTRIVLSIYAIGKQV